MNVVNAFCCRIRSIRQFVLGYVLCFMRALCSTRWRPAVRPRTIKPANLWIRCDVQQTPQRLKIQLPKNIGFSDGCQINTLCTAHIAHRNSQRDFDSHNVKHLHLQSCLTHDCAAIAIFPCSIFRWSVGSRTKWAWSALISNMPISFQNMPIAAQCLPAQSGRAIYKKQQQSGHQNENDHFKLWRSHEDAFQHSLVTMQRCIQTTLTTNATSVCAWRRRNLLIINWCFNWYSPHAAI